MYSGRLREFVSRLYESLKRSEQAELLGKVAVSVTHVGEEKSRAEFRHFTVFSDEPVSSGGNDEAPTPLEYFLASLGFCEDITFVRNAALAGLEFTRLETKIVGYWDRRGQFEIEGSEPSFKTIMMETWVETMEDERKVAEIMQLTHRRCPVLSTLKKAVEIKTRLFVNGREVRMQ